MSSFDASFPLDSAPSGSISIRPTDLTPVTQWLGELQGRVVEWSRGIKDVSREEWGRLQGSVKGALSTERVETVLRDFLARLGLRADSASLAEALSVELKARIMAYRHGNTIEFYENHLSIPPQIRL